MAGLDELLLERIWPEPAALPRRRQLLAALPVLRRRRAFASPTLDAEQGAAALLRLQREEAAAAVEVLLGAHLSAALPPTAFASWWRDGRDVPEAWGVLQRAGQGGVAVPHVPMPGELPLAVARRLWSSLAHLRAGDPRLGLWRARMALGERGPGEAERVLAQAFPGARPQPGGSPMGGAALLSELVLERAELALSRGAVSRARAELERAAVLVARVPALAQLLAVALVASGEPERAQEVLGPAPQWEREGPPSLQALAAHCPWAKELVPSARAGVPSGLGWSPKTRLDVGASALAFAALSPGGRPRFLELDVAAGLRPREREWAMERQRAWNRPGAPERELVLDPRPRRWDRAPGRAPADSALRATLGGARTRCLCLEPIRDRRGELAGWLWGEWEHHLPPAPEVLGAMAEAARERVLAALYSGEPAHVEPAPSVAVPCVREGAPGVLHGLAPEPLHPSDPLAQFGLALIGRMGVKLAQRRFWFFVPDGERARIAAEGGGAFADGEHKGGTLALERVRRTGAPLLALGPEPGLFPAAEAASGAVVPLESGGLFLGWFALVSERQRDFSQSDLARLARVAEAAGPEALFAALSSADRSAGRGPLSFPADPNGRARLASQLALAARSPGPVLVVGPSGAGSTAAARWICALSGAPLPLECAGADLGGFLRRADEQGAAILCERIELWSKDAQREWVERVGERGGPHVRWLATSRMALPSGVETGSVDAGLAALFDGRELLLQPLEADRANLLLRLAERLHREAVAQGASAPRLSDEAEALLWRLSYADNLRELGRWASDLVARYPGATVSADAVVELLAERGQRPPARFPYRGVDPALLAAAVAASRTAGGRANKCRAARLLGWDPDTLVARLAALGLS